MTPKLRPARVLAGGVAAVGLLFTTACAGLTETALETAYSACVDPSEGVDVDADGAPFEDFMRLTDEGHTLIVETPGDEDDDSMVGYFAYLCLVSELDTPERVTSSIDTTSSMMGRQTSAADGLTYEYTYHPDNGLYLLVTDQE